MLELTIRKGVYLVPGQTGLRYAWRIINRNVSKVGRWLSLAMLLVPSKLCHVYVDCFEPLLLVQPGLPPGRGEVFMKIVSKVKERELSQLERAAYRRHLLEKASFN